VYVISSKKREELPVAVQGTEKATFRWLIDRSSGAKTYGLRLFEIQPGGIVPLHQHPEEHEIFVISGKADVMSSSGSTPARKDDVVFIPSNMVHGVDNRKGKEAFKFICVIPLLSKE
jgi:quercetin dioxygenase-like cupin family protein